MIAGDEYFMRVRQPAEPSEKRSDLRLGPAIRCVARMDKQIAVRDGDRFVGVVRVGNADDAHQL